MWRYVYRDFSELNKNDQLALFKAMKQELFPETSNKLDKTLINIRESRFSSGLCCMHCKSTSVKRNGKYRSRQRYLCKDCGRTFNDMTNTPLSGTHHPEKWMKYIEMMVNGVSLRKIAEKLKIHISTAFYWRHKVLNALGSHGFGQLSGIVESDETFFRESLKGRKFTHRKAKERGEKDEKRGISNLKIAVVVALDRTGNVLAKVAGRGRVKAEEIDAAIGEYIEPTSLLCTDTATNYKKYALLKNLKHETVNLNQNQRVKKVIYHIQHVNNFHGRLKGWMNRFQGVGTYYLDNYLHWYCWIELHKKLAFENQIEQMLISACQKSCLTTVETIRRTNNKRAI